MYKFWILVVASFIINGACRRSEFSTTTRQCKHGLVSYSNRQPIEKRKIPAVRYPQKHLSKTSVPFNGSSVTRASGPNNKAPVITKPFSILPAGTENLIASTTNDPTLMMVNIPPLAPENEPNLSKRFHRPDTLSVKPVDSIKMIAPKRGTSMDMSVEQVILLKNGKKVVAGVVCQSNDTLFAQLLSKTNSTAVITLAEVDTILKVRYTDQSTGNIVEKRKNEPLGKIGFICSIIGFVPIIGLPFGLFALVFGAISSARIKRHPERLKGAKTAKSSIVIGCLALAVNIIFLIVLAISKMGQVTLYM